MEAPTLLTPEEAADAAEAAELTALTTDDAIEL